MLAGNLTEAGARAALEVAARLRTRLVRAADGLPRFEAQGSAMTIRHSHERAIALEPNELLGALTETLVVVAGHAHIRLEPREAACAAGETFWNRLHRESAESTVRYRRRVCDSGPVARPRESPRRRRKSGGLIGWRAASPRTPREGNDHATASPPSLGSRSDAFLLEWSPRQRWRPPIRGLRKHVRERLVDWDRLFVGRSCLG